jgi:hypothetical protein
MVWAPAIALTILLVGLVLVAYEAFIHKHQ